IHVRLGLSRRVGQEGDARRRAWESNRDLSRAQGHPLGQVRTSTLTPWTTGMTCSSQCRGFPARIAVGGRNIPAPRTESVRRAEVVVDLRALQHAGVIDVAYLGLRVELVDLPTALAVAIARLLHATERQVGLRPDR